MSQHEDDNVHESAKWSLIDDLAAPHSEASNDRNVPEVKLLDVREGVRIIRIAFRAGDVMASHKAPGPIVLLGQSGEVEVCVGEPGDPGAREVVLRPGRALHIDTGKVHSLTAAEPVSITLLLLTGA